MSAPRCLVVLVWLAFAGTLSAQTAAAPSPAASPIAAATDERAARVAQRYQAMLAANPTEGLALDRFWKYHEEHGTTAALLDTYQKAANAPDADLAAILVDGFLLKKIGRLDEAAALYDRANKRDPVSPLPWIAAAELASVQNHPDEAANGYAQALSKLPATDRHRTDLLLKQGTALLAAGKVGEAAESWEKNCCAQPGGPRGAPSTRRRLREETVWRIGRSRNMSTSKRTRTLTSGRPRAGNSGVCRRRRATLTPRAMRSNAVLR